VIVGDLIDKERLSAALSRDVEPSARLQATAELNIVIIADAMFAKAADNLNGSRVASIGTVYLNSAEL
jgi:hypothetical protein